MAGTREPLDRGDARLVAPAKLTTSLRVVGVRPDGYHLLQAEMVALDLADHLSVRPGGHGLTVTADHGIRADGLSAGPDNLVNRALAAVGRQAAVRLHKRIPVQGGLGGGSADAAAILRWAGCTDPDVAARLGADVPFCVAGGRATVSGLGDLVAPLPFRPQAFVLLLPPFGVDTAAVYRAWDRMAADTGRAGGPVGRAESPAGGGALSEPVNDLTAAALAVEPRLARWRDRLGEVTGATPVLAGSGSTWFVAGDAAVAAVDGRQWLDVGAARGRLITARAVPAGWDGDAGARTG
ncbi:MAG TPA: 4-(cytidine 5'-diphospho)-2-C-methyl-D-erythritol kinase [Acidimicrobiales bacterium]|nr:4-(cytidine 5'-diphospho)-2-C-methyl-D-erythritol kinase [Acidimicrobiales bacterium]